MFLTKCRIRCQKPAECLPPSKAPANTDGAPFSHIHVLWTQVMEYVFMVAEEVNRGIFISKNVGFLTKIGTIH